MDLWDCGDKAAAKSKGPIMAEVLAASKPGDWRSLDPENTLYMDLAGGRVVIELAPAFARAGTAILGVSADPVAKQDKFKAKHDLSIALGSDEGHEMLKAYGVWAKKSLYGRSYMGILRNTYLIGPDGRIAQVWEKVKVAGHASEVLEAAKAL